MALSGAGAAVPRRHHGAGLPADDLAQAVARQRNHVFIATAPLDFGAVGATQSLAHGHALLVAGPLALAGVEDGLPDADGFRGDHSGVEPELVGNSGAATPSSSWGRKRISMRTSWASVTVLARYPSQSSRS